MDSLCAGKTEKPLLKSRPPRQCQSLSLGPRSLTPHEIPESLRHLFSNKVNTVAPGFEGIPKTQSSSTGEKNDMNGVPPAEPGNTPEIDAAALLQAAM